MGYIKTADAMVTSATHMLDTLYASNFTQFLQGLGNPVIGTWYNYNEVLSGATTGSETVDELLGQNSPIRYNKISNYPVYGFNQDIIPDLEVGEGGLLDLNIDMEVTLLPNNIRPSAYDYYRYTFQTATGDTRSILFRINNITMQSIRGNGYYKVGMHMIEIDDSYRYNQLEAQVAKRLTANLDTIGTNEQCIIEETDNGISALSQKVFQLLLDDYIDLFYNDKYNAILLNGWLRGGYTIYDPYLTNFIITSTIFEHGSPVITLVNFDPEEDFRRNYNKTFFRAIQTKELTDIRSDMHYQPLTFTTTNTNPFAYWGIDTVFKLNVYEDRCHCTPNMADNGYMNYAWLKNIGSDELTHNPIIDVIIKYFNTNNYTQLFDEETLNWFRNYEIKYDEYHIHIIPIILYLLLVFNSSIAI